MERVYQHFVVENNPKCANNHGYCVYDQTGCAVGCLLTAEDARTLESLYGGSRICSLYGRQHWLAEYFDDTSLGLLGILQSIHDNHKTSLMKARLIDSLQSRGFAVPA